MVIYTITNLLTEKVYIGQTIMKKPKNRWEFHRWTLNKQRHTNQHLQRAWNKYGQNNFEFKVIDHANTLEELNKLETKYIRQYKETGQAYNMTDGGDNAILSSESKQKLSISLKENYLKNPLKEWGVVVSPRGQEINVISLSEFCRSHGVRRDRMKDLFSGKIEQHKGWRLKTPIKFGRKKGYTFDKKGNGKLYTIENTENGDIFHNVTSIETFAKENGIHPHTLRYSLYNRNNPKRGNKLKWKVNYV